MGSWRGCTNQARGGQMWSQANQTGDWQMGSEASHSPAEQTSNCEDLCMVTLE